MKKHFVLIPRSRIARLTGMWPLLVLVLQNLVIFWNHYFNDVGFPWDFAQGYYGIVAFWTSVIVQGVFPQWMPFQQMGYPFAMQLQSGIYYPPLWIFPLFHIPYTSNAAVTFQCLHVLFGSIGMFLLLRQYLDSRELACLGAFIFQLFGGFYSNSEHVDIIRAFAFAPWVFWAFTQNARGSFDLPRRALLVPLLIFLFATGGYPGNFISSIFMMSIYVLLQWLDAYFNGTTVRHLIAVSAGLSALVLLGFALAAVQLAPAWIYREQLVRHEDFQSLWVAAIWLEQLPGLFLSNRNLPGEISMSSTYITLPALILACFAPLEQLKKYWIELCIGLIGFLMAGGDSSPFWLFMTTVAPPLRFSRVPSSDYRIFIVIPIILFAMIGMRAVLKKKLNWRAILTRGIFILIWFSLGIMVVYRTFWNRQAVGATLVAMVALGLVVLASKGRSRVSKLVLPAMIILVSIDGARVLSDMETWKAPSISSYYGTFGWPYEKNNRLVTYDILQNLPKQRPARQQTDIFIFSWGGYMDGRYMISDKATTNLLRSSEAAKANPIYKDYMLMGWSPLLLDPESVGARNGQASLPDGTLANYLKNTEKASGEGVEQTSYGINDISYHVSLKEPRLMVENEIYFPGWHGQTVSTEGTTELQPQVVDKIFRAWLLPAGNYYLVAQYEFPNIWLYRGISVGALVIWVAILAAYWRRQPRPRGTVVA